MTHLRSAMKLFALVAFICIASSAAHAQATRTWVSGVGDDANPCSRTAPCKTFAGAISKTFTGGEIDALDPGGFGTITITKSITLDGGSGFASILASGTNGVNVNFSVVNANDPEKRVVLRRLSINGTGSSGAVGQRTGLRGINITTNQTGLAVVVENSFIQNFSQEGINTSGVTASNVLVDVKDTNIQNCATGINLITTTGFIVGIADRVRIERNTGNGVTVGTHGHFSIKDSFVAFNLTGTGLAITGAVTDGTLNIESCMIIHNSTAVSNGAGGSFVRLSNTAIMENNTGLASSGGVIQSHGNNAISGNASPGVAPTVIGPQ
jgi:hypothetical protein